MTNLGRWKRRIAYCPDCARCNRVSEGILHAIRDCKWAREVWEVLIPPDLEAEFFYEDLEPWVSWLLEGGGVSGNNERWVEKVFVTCRWKWVWRNE